MWIVMRTYVQKEGKKYWKNITLNLPNISRNARNDKNGPQYSFHAREEQYSRVWDYQSHFDAITMHPSTRRCR